MLDKLTHESFSPHDGETFNLVLEDQTLAMKLVEVSPLPTPRRQPWDAPSEKRQPFSLVFLGPNQPPLDQGSYRFEHEGVGTMERLFITPVHENEQGRYYEAIFT